MSVISSTLRKYAALEDGEVMLQSILREAADELDRKDALIEAIKFDMYNYDHRLTYESKNNQESR